MSKKRLKSKLSHSLAIVMVTALCTQSMAQMSCETLFGESIAQTQTNSPRAEVTLKDLLKKGTPTDREAKIAVEEKLLAIENQLKKEFVGWDNVVSQLMNACRLLIFYGDDPEISKKPIVVPILGFPGYGKTTLIQRWLELMGLQDIQHQESIVSGQPYIPIDEMVGVGRPANESPALAKQRPLIDYVLTIDEIQKLMDYTDVEALIKSVDETVITDDPKGEKLKSLTDRKSQVTAILKSRQFWWEVLGNGTRQVRIENPKPNLDTLATYIENYKGLSVRALSLLAKLQSLEKQLDQGTTNIDSVDGARMTYQNQTAQASQWKRNSLTILRKIKTENSESLGDYASLSASELLEAVLIGPDDFITAVEENYRRASSAAVLNRFNRGIIIITGNPSSIIEQLVKKSMDGRGRVDAESLRRNSLAVTDADMMDFFVSKIGPEAGSQSRYNAPKWKILPPFGDKQWRDLIRRSLDQFERLTVQDGKIYTGKDITMKFDESLVEYLYRVAVDPLTGPRSYFDALNQSLTSLPTQIPSQLRQYMLAHPEWAATSQVHLNVSFSSGTRELVVKEDGSGGFESRIKLSLTEKPGQDNANISFPAIAKAQMSVYQAARIVVGTIMFRSLPKQAVEVVPSAEESIDTLWSQPDVNYFNHLKAKLMVSMAGYVAEKMLMDKSGIDISVHAKIDMEYIVTMIGQLKAELERRRELDKYKLSGKDESTIRQLFGSSMSQDRVITAIFKNDDAAVFRYLDHEVRKVMLAQKDLITAISSNLLNKTRLEPDDIRDVFETYSTQPTFSDRVRRSLRRVLGGPDTPAMPALDVAHIVHNEPGSIQNPVPQLQNPYALDHRSFPATALGRLWERLSRRLRDNI